MRATFITLLPGLLFSLLIAISPSGDARTVIHFVCVYEENMPKYTELYLLYRMAFEALGFEFTMQYAPSRRATREANIGTVDGECARVKNYTEFSGAQNLVIVNALVETSEWQMWSYSPDINIDRINTPGKDSYRVGYHRGTTFVENYLKQHHITHAEPLSTPLIGVKMLAGMRLEVYIDAKSDIVQNIKKLGVSRPLYMIHTLGRLESYPFLHKRHSHLAAPLAAELNQLLSDRGGPIE